MYSQIWSFSSLFAALRSFFFNTMLTVWTFSFTVEVIFNRLKCSTKVSWSILKIDCWLFHYQSPVLSRLVGAKRDCDCYKNVLKWKCRSRFELKSKGIDCYLINWISKFGFERTEAVSLYKGFRKTSTSKYWRRLNSDSCFSSSSINYQLLDLILLRFTHFDIINKLALLRIGGPNLFRLCLIPK